MNLRRVVVCLVVSFVALAWHQPASAQSKPIPPTPLLDMLAAQKETQAEAAQSQASQQALLANKIKQLEEQGSKSQAEFSQLLKDLRAQLDSARKRELELEQRLVKSKEPTLNSRTPPNSVPSVMEVSPLQIGLLLSWKLPCGCEAQLHLHHDGIYFFHGKKPRVRLPQSSQPHSGWTLFAVLSDGLTEVYADPKQEHFQIVRPVR